MTWLIMIVPGALLALSAFVDPETCEWVNPFRNRTHSHTEGKTK